MMEIQISNDQLREAINSVLIKQSAGLLEVEIKDVIALDPTGVSYSVDRMVVLAAAKEAPTPVPVERQTTTGFTMKLATDRGRRIA